MIFEEGNNANRVVDGRQWNLSMQLGYAHKKKEQAYIYRIYEKNKDFFFAYQ